MNRQRLTAGPQPISHPCGLDSIGSVSNLPAAPAARRPDRSARSPPRRVLSSGTTVPGRYEEFRLGFSDPPLRLETTAANFFAASVNARGEC